MKIDRLLFLCFSIMLLSSCASSRKTMTDVSVSMGDSAVVKVADSAAVSVVRKDSAKVCRWDYSQTIGSIFDYNDDEELIHELITESTDSLGNKITTTDRTIHRKGHGEKQTTTSDVQRKREEQTSVYLSMLDSITNSRSNIYNTHWQGRDSVAQNSEKNTTEIKATPWWKKLLCFLWIVLGIYAIIRLDNKKHKEE